MSPTRATDTLALQKIAPLIHEVHGERVILDSDLARIYGVSTTRLNEQVKRNAARFPADFAFRLDRKEMTDLMSQIAISNSRHGGRRKLPLVFTEHGAIMAANVLNSKQAVKMSVFVVRAFVKLRELLTTNKELADNVRELELKVGIHGRAIVSILATIRQMTEPTDKKPRPIGFRAKREATGTVRPKQRAHAARKKWPLLTSDV